MAAKAALKLVDTDRKRDAVSGRAQFRQAKTADEQGWRHAIKDFLTEIKGMREEKTLEFYTTHLGVASDWMIEHGRDGQGVPLSDFKARDLREYLAYRADCKNPQTGKPIKDATRRQDAIAIKVFVKFCVREEYIDRNPLADYKLPKAERAHVPLPADEDIRKLLQASLDRWSVKLNPGARFLTRKAQQFFSRRQHAILCTLVDAGLRIGEALDLKIENFDAERLQISVGQSKGDKPRTIPISEQLRDVIDAWLRVRPKCDTRYLFVSEYGDKITYSVVRKCITRDAEFAGIAPISFHKLRHYAATTIAKRDVWAAQLILGHSSPTVTRAYLHADADHVRQAHLSAAPLSRILVSKRTERAEQQKKRKKLI